MLRSKIIKVNEVNENNVTSAIEAYVSPVKKESKEYSPMLKIIVNHNDPKKVP